MDNFSESVLRLAAKIPKGKLATYKQIAIALGKPDASRAVGNALNKNPHLKDGKIAGLGRYLYGF